MKRETYPYCLFVSAALFNWLVGLGFLFIHRPLLEVLAPSTLTEHTIFLHLFAVVVLCFGVAYYQAGQNLSRKSELIKLGALSKASIFFLVLCYWLAGLINWKLLGLASVDLIYAVLFTHALRELQQS